jgi:radical SAM superfamily enzyme YgiQ (UPF0313 family)
MRCLVVSPNQSRAPDPVLPLGAAYVAALLRDAGHEVELFDACFAGPAVHAELEARIADFRPDVVGLSLRNVDEMTHPRPRSSLPHHRAIAETLRRAAPHAPLILGGPAFTLFPRALLEALGADYGITGEAEGRLRDLLEAIGAHRARPGEILHGGPSDLDKLPLPARDLLDVERYAREGGSVNLQTKRGCAFDCSYCTYPDLEGRLVRTRSPQRVVDEMEHVLERYGVDSFFFVDSVFNVPPDHAIAVCREIRRRRLPVTWSAYVTPAAVTGPLVDAMAGSGCRSVDLGTDAAAEPTLRGLGKGFRVVTIQRAADLLRAAGIPFCHSLVFGGPGETWQTVDETVRNVVETGPAAVVAIVGLRVFPGTAIAARAMAEGVARESIGLEPLVWIAPGVREGLGDRLAEVAAQHPRWVVPGVTPDVPDRVRLRLRSRGAKGPLWEGLARTLTD